MRKLSQRLSRAATPAGTGTSVPTPLPRNGVPISRLYRPEVVARPAVPPLPTRRDPELESFGYNYQQCGGGRRVIRLPVHY